MPSSSDRLPVCSSCINCPFPERTSFYSPNGETSVAFEYFPIHLIANQIPLTLRLKCLLNPTHYHGISLIPDQLLPWFRQKFLISLALLQYNPPCSLLLVMSLKGLHSLIHSSLPPVLPLSLCPLSMILLGDLGAGDTETKKKKNPWWSLLSKSSQADFDFEQVPQNIVRNAFSMLRSKYPEGNRKSSNQI